MKHPAGYRYFHIVTMVYTALLLISNTIAVKIIHIGDFVTQAGIICFSLSYVLNDAIVEVYGYQRTRSAIWWSFFCLALMSLLYYLAVQLPPAQFWQDQEAFKKFFLTIPRITIASFIAYIIGSFLNAYIMSIMKVKSGGKQLWKRTIASTIIGEGADSIVFNLIAFLGVFPISDILKIMVTGFILKTLYEIVCTPFTYFVVNKLKKLEQEDKFDNDISYNPFK
jgi:queuosine precursor transporter